MQTKPYGVKLKSSVMTLGAPSSMVFTATAGGAVVKLYIDNALGLLAETGIVTIGATAQEMDVTGDVSVTAFKRYTQTYALIINKINYSASTAGQLNNPIKVYKVNIDGNNSLQNIDIAIELSNQAFNDQLQSIYTQPFVWDFLTGLTVVTAPAVVTTLAFGVAAIMS
jgi:hypothetical protein